MAGATPHPSPGAAPPGSAQRYGAVRHPGTQRESYHHGDLRAALVAAGYELARTGGAPAVGVREVTRRVGVTARAAYRHFESREALLVAVAAPALAELARAIERRLAGIEEADPPRRARAGLRAVGEGYIGYALDEPGGFEVAFFGLATMDAAHDRHAAGDSGLTPYQHLMAALGALTAAGLLQQHRQPAAATYCWSAVHGFATLATRGPIRDLPRPALDAMAQELVAATVAGLVGSPGAWPDAGAGPSLGRGQVHPPDRQVSP